MTNLQSQQLIHNISALLNNVRKNIAAVINHTMVLTYSEQISSTLLTNSSNTISETLSRNFQKSISDNQKGQTPFCLFNILLNKPDFINILNSDNGKTS